MEKDNGKAEAKTRVAYAAREEKKNQLSLSTIRGMSGMCTPTSSKRELQEIETFLGNTFFFKRLAIQIGSEGRNL